MRAAGCATSPRGFAPHARRPLRPRASWSGRPLLARAVRCPSAFSAEDLDAEDVFDGDVSVTAGDAPDADDGAVSFSSFCATALEMTDADVAKVLERVPKLKGYDVERVLAPKVDLLARELGALPVDLRVVLVQRLARAPSLRHARPHRTGRRPPCAAHPHETRGDGRPPEAHTAPLHASLARTRRLHVLARARAPHGGVCTACCRSASATPSATPPL